MNTIAKDHNFKARMSDEIYHDMLSPEETQNIRAEVRRFAETHVAPRARKIGEADESVEGFAFDLYRRMGDEGLFAIPFGTENKGRGLAHRVAATATTIEELAYFSNSVAAVYDVNCILAGRTLERASEEVREECLHPLIRGEKIGAFATTEPEASTDLSPKALKTRATLKNGIYTVNGHKRWITNAPVADFVTMLCTSKDGLVELTIDLHAKGVTVGKPDQKLGNRGQLTGDIYLKDVEVPESRRIGTPGEGLRIALQTLTYGRVGIAATGVGMAQACFDETMAHLKTRHAFGKPIGANQYWQFKMAERACHLENARSLYLKAALRMDSGVAFPEPEAAMAKFYATELAVDMARDGIQAMGGYGFMRSLSHDDHHNPVETHYRDAKIAEIYEGTNEIQRMVVARTLFGKEMTG
ncbi:acyl-CoA dehydrogenase family protein [Marivita hallyeonensis]|uniref:Butyryl-CoA dehydrogenase n=1 Tax=Marivita hallyeonensis TaxID=996342 RepID=A0A1M5XMN8_9RHOB|nr:acyl-CoA dehydrogenase family protein [Marivita hallyeonensis]SHI01019.1 butyryl-CoA dehydrogenase [Marivita hallyeonensis]